MIDDDIDIEVGQDRRDFNDDPGDRVNLDVPGSCKAQQAALQSTGGTVT